jgi:hypothetical protein
MHVTIASTLHSDNMWAMYADALHIGESAERHGIQLAPYSLYILIALFFSKNLRDCHIPSF